MRQPRPPQAESPPDESPHASDLCTACGLCCSGPLYNMLMLDPDEVDGARANGLPVIDEGPGDCFWFPCPLLHDKCCTIYEVRPGGCRKFRCELLLRLDRAEVTIDGAMVHVEAAWERVQDVEALIGVETIPELRRRRAELREAGQALPAGPLRDSLNALDAVLDTYFRRPNQNQRAAYAALEGRTPARSWETGFSIDLKRTDPSE